MLLSIDFDFFVRENPLWDWGHTESPFHRDLMWPIREAGFVGGDLRAEMDPNTHSNPKPAEFWSALSAAGLDLRGARVAVGDSHLWGLPFFLGVPTAGKQCAGKRVVHVDAHCDLGYHTSRHALQRSVAEGESDCASWLYTFMVNRKNLSLDVVYPAWKGLEEINDHLPWRKTAVAKRTRWSVFGDNPDLFSERVEAVYICRSGAWVPPWLDQTFIDLVKEAGARAGSQIETPFVDSEGCDVMVARDYTPMPKFNLSQMNVGV